ncbi:MAG: alpha-glucosidase [Silicimonas sp.]|nr:alpha-glucosidase [Silicimonas sp.]
MTADPDWWRGAVIYQIYPRSFQDSNGDGVGDLSGIIHRLPHVASLGVDAIWISPFFTSPMLDFGYDVSDYRDVDPMFGTLGDFDALVGRAHELGVKVIIDLVLSHTSDQHPWFRESRSSRDNPKSDWYVWADPKPDGSPPNNWLSIFGGSAWEWDGQRMQYYLHNFLTQQPDLNFHNEAVRQELLDVTRFWLERGVDGFRLDTVNFYYADAQLRDNPPLAAEDRNDNTAPSVNPYNYQDHLYDKTQPENLGFLKNFRSLLDEYKATTSVGEIGESQRGTQVQAEYTSDGRLHMAYDFDLLANAYPTGHRVASIMDKIETHVANGWACWAYSNHDVVRHTSRWNLGSDAHRVYLALLLSLKGTACLYQGEELGLTEAYVAFEDLQDPYGKRFWPKFKGRDGCRTPMPWSNDQANGGFSDGKPWLPVAMEHIQSAAEVQDRDPESMLNFYRRMIEFRGTYPALLKGAYHAVEADETFISFIREHGNARVFCAFNLSGDDREVAMPDGSWKIDGAAPFEFKQTDTETTLPAWQALYAFAGE